MSGADPTPEIRHASRTQVRSGDRGVRHAAATRRRLPVRLAATGFAALSVAIPARAQTLTAATLGERYLSARKVRSRPRGLPR